MPEHQRRRSRRIHHGPSRSAADYPQTGGNSNGKCPSGSRNDATGQRPTVRRIFDRHAKVSRSAPSAEERTRISRQHTVQIGTEFVGCNYQEITARSFQVNCSWRSAIRVNVVLFSIMLVSRIAAVGLVAALVTIIVSTHTFVRFDATRIRVVRSPIEQRTPTVDVPVHDPRTTQLNPPFVLIARISNPRPAVQQFSILLNGSVICQRPVRPGQQSRIDCVVKEAIDPHQVTIRATTDQWTLEYLELATHYGSSIGAYELIILPASSTNFRRPPLVRVTVMWVILAATLLIPRSRSLPQWARVGHTILGTIIALVVIICLSSQWISPYRLIFSGKTVTLWFAILASPRLWSFARWLFSTENLMEAVYARFVRAALVAGIVAGGYGQLMVTRLQQAYDGN